MNQQGDSEAHSPVVYDDAGVTYMFIQHNNVFLLTASRQNCNAASILLFLHRVVDVRIPTLDPGTQMTCSAFSLFTKLVCA